MGLLNVTKTVAQQAAAWFLSCIHLAYHSGAYGDSVVYEMNDGMHAPGVVIVYTTRAFNNEALKCH